MSKKIEYSCETCKDTGEGQYDDRYSCRDCCDHFDKDSHCCLQCGEERDWGGEIDAAMDRYEDR